ncbi:MAG: DNA repair and recombination protein RadB [Candidatus Aenigmatarchaeota archaeon]|nr:MAG: DNA repair and recombination protein RadB [Candidatus Aenigmarchaeota archaeon]
MDIGLPKPLDELGRIEGGAITNFYGAAGTGKTNLCLLACLECIRKGGKPVFIDTEGGFSLERVKQLVPNYKETLDKITLLEPKSFEEQGKIIRSLQEKEFDMIVLDSAVALYRLEYADPMKEAIEPNRELSKQLSVLSNTAREKKMPVIITSHVFRSWETQKNEIVGGDSVRYWSKVIVFLERTGRTSERKATIIKHRWVPEGKSVKFVIVQEGIKPASGFKLF